MNVRTIKLKDTEYLINRILANLNGENPALNMQHPIYRFNLKSLYLTF